MLCAAPPSVMSPFTLPIATHCVGATIPYFAAIV